MVTKATTTVGLIILAAISLIGVITITLTNKVVPSDLWLITGTLIGGAAGVAIPTPGAGTTTTTTTLPAKAPVAATVPPTFAAPPPQA